MATKAFGGQRKMTNFLSPARKTEAENRESQSIKAIKGTLQVGSGDHGVRPTLKTLQQASDNRGLTRPQNPSKSKSTKRKRDDDDYSQKKRTKSKKIVPSSGSEITVFQDPETPAETKVDVKSEMTGDQCTCLCHEKETQKEKGGEEESEKLKTPEEEAHDLMCGDAVPEEYWKQLAEERRQALDESLLENELLHAEVEQLKEEKANLSDMAEQAEYFANIVRQLTEEDEDKDKDEETHEEKECDEEESTEEKGKTQEKEGEEEKEEEKEKEEQS